MKIIFQKVLKTLARAVLKKQKPQIVTITGSVGKTSTKEAIYCVLSNKFQTRRNIKNYNNEIGVPLTIFGQESGGKNPLAWLKIILKAEWLAFFKDNNYPQVLVLEIAADKPGDLKYLMEILPSHLLKAAVLTAVSPAHLEAFGSLEKILEEKTLPFNYLPDNGIAIIDKDTCPWPKTRAFIHSPALSYSLEQPSEVKAVAVEIDERGARFDFEYQNKVYPFLLKGAVAKHQLYALLAGFVAGVVFSLRPEEILPALLAYQVLPGRMRQAMGKNGFTIIDDTYNSSPQACCQALRSLADLSFGQRKIAVLADMLELGQESEALHRQAGKLASQLKIDNLFTLGEQAKFILEQARASGFNKENSRHFASQKELIDFLQFFLQPSDIVLIKGSQGMRMEKVVKALLANPEQADEFLVRQNKQWLTK